MENELAVSTSVEKESISADNMAVEKEISILSQSYEIENESNTSLFDLSIEDPFASMMKYIQHQEINYPAASTPLTLDVPQEQNIPDEMLVGSWVSVGYINKWYPGIVEEISLAENEATVKFMEIKGQNKFSWPKVDDRLPVIMNDILCVVLPPKQYKRFWSLTNLDYAKSCAAFDAWVDVNP